MEENGIGKEKLNTQLKMDNYQENQLMKLKFNSLMIDITSGQEPDLQEMLNSTLIQEMLLLEEKMLTYSQMLKPLMFSKISISDSD